MKETEDNDIKELRDRLAAKAMVALMCNQSYLFTPSHELLRTPDDFAKAAYKYADAMLRQRNK